jgi:hypothetical protein
LSVEGKAIVSQNPLKHGFYSAEIVEIRQQMAQSDREVKALFSEWADKIF